MEQGRSGDTRIEVLAIGNCLLLKADQNPGLARSYKNEFNPD